jgi:8-oxo-dGTP pyrophosphatase MutT (NUDIX family)
MVDISKSKYGDVIVRCNSISLLLASEFAKSYVQETAPTTAILIDKAQNGTLENFHDFVFLFSGAQNHVYGNSKAQRECPYIGPNGFLSGSSVCVVIQNSRKLSSVLLVKDKFKSGFDFPGGYRLRDETYSECAVRELREETGLEVSHVTEIAEFDSYGVKWFGVLVPNRSKLFSCKASLTTEEFENLLNFQDSANEIHMIRLIDVQTLEDEKYDIKISEKTLYSCKYVLQSMDLGFKDFKLDQKTRFPGVKNHQFVSTAGLEENLSELKFS